MMLTLISARRYTLASRARKSPPLTVSLKQAKNAVAVVAVVLGGVDPSLGCNGVRPARGVVIGKAMDVVALLAESSGRRRPGQTLRPRR